MLGTDRVDVDERVATFAELAAVHHPAYLQKLESFCATGGGKLDPDTYACGISWDAARQAAGAGLAAIDALAAGHGDVAFVVARPPGHHALADRAMGFCLLNNVAVAAAALADAGERVMIIDWDVHHGQRNGSRCSGTTTVCVSCRPTRIACIRAPGRSTRPAVRTRRA